MTLLAKAMELVFIGAWFIAMAGLLYGTIHWIPMWLVGFKKLDRHKGHWRKSLIGFGVFLLAVALCFVAGAVAQYWGGGWG